MKIAIGGKGGVGKSTISSLFIQYLAQVGKRVLAIDADSSPHLARLLGFKEMDAVVPISEMRDLLIERSEKSGAFYKLNPNVSDIPEKFMLKKGNISLMVIGAVQIAGEGCACAENTVLKALLNQLVLKKDEIIIIDLEAGVEPLGRGTISMVDHFLIIVQPYLGSIETSKKIYKLSKELGIKNIHFFGNRVKNQEDIEFIERNLGTNLLGWLDESELLQEYERKGLSNLLIEGSILDRIRDTLNKLGIV